MVASPRNHRQLTPRSPGLGEFLFATGVVAKGQDLSQVAMEDGGDALAVAPWTQLNAVNQGAEHFGRLDAPIASITRKDAAAFLETIATLRPDYGKFGNAKSLPLNRLLKERSGERGHSNATVNRHARALSGLFEWTLGSGLHEGPNPFAGQRRKVARSSRTGWQPFSTGELKALFAHPLATAP